MKKLYLLAVLLLLSSCTKFVNWGKITFNQACKIEDFSDVPRNHIRSVRVYDQFNTISLIDAMWLSDEVRTAYVEIYAKKHYFSAEQQENMLANELRSNQHTISFYVLIWLHTKCGGLFDKPNPYWDVALVTEHGSFHPRLIKKVDLPCEYVNFFGKRKNSFQKAFYVEFDTYDAQGEPILNATNFMTLCFSSLTKKTFLRWDLQAGQMICIETDHCDPVDQCDHCKDLIVE